jgi:DNA polymerase/3'-5' exonuclease PolX
MTKSKRLDKFAIAAALQDIAALLELKGGKDRFKARAYQAGARVVAGLSEDVGDVVLELAAVWRRKSSSFTSPVSRLSCWG